MIARWGAMTQDTRAPQRNIEQEIAREIHFAMDQLGAPSTVLLWMDHWAEGHDHRSVLFALQVFNDSRSKAPRLGNPRIAKEIYTTLEILGARPVLLGLISIWTDGHDDAMVLNGLRVINRRGILFEGSVLTAAE